MRRVNVSGTSGSGKTTFARRLAQRLDVPHIELDALYHRPNWETTPKDEYRTLVARAAEANAWVIDGNYTSTRDIVLARADTVVFLDYPLPLVLWRLTKRTLRRGITRQELWHGNRESVWRHFFTRESLYLWVLQTYRKRRRQFHEARSSGEFAHIEFMRFDSPKRAADWLECVQPVDNS